MQWGLKRVNACRVLGLIYRGERKLSERRRYCPGVGLWTILFEAQRRSCHEVKGWGLGVSSVSESRGLWHWQMASRAIQKLTYYIRPTSSCNAVATWVGPDSIPYPVFLTSVKIPEGMLLLFQFSHSVRWPRGKTAAVAALLKVYVASGRKPSFSFDPPCLPVQIVN